MVFNGDLMVVQYIYIYTYLVVDIGIYICQNWVL